MYYLYFICYKNVVIYICITQNFDKGGMDMNGNPKEEDKRECNSSKAPEEYILKYSCHSCGAKILSSNHIPLMSCPYCGDTDLSQGKFEGELKPDYVLPFKYDEKEAKSKILKFYQKKSFIPDVFTNPESLNEIKGVYVPVWLFSQSVIGKVKIRCEKNHVAPNEDNRFSEKKIYDVFGNGRSNLKNIPYLSDSIIPKDNMDFIEPFDYSDIKPYSKEIAGDFFVSKYDITKGEARKKIDLISKDSFHRHVADELDGYDILSTSGDIKTTGTKSVQVLLPIWFLSTRWNDENFLLTMNGQTGKIFSKIPFDEKKFKKMFLIIAASAGLLFSIIWSIFAV